jgi:hypothetical protein
MAQRRSVRWWEAALPAGVWLYISACLLRLARLTLRVGVPRIFIVRSLLRLNTRVSRAGFNSWRFWGGKWK